MRGDVVRTQLLCTFAHRKDLDLIVDYVSNAYTITERRMFVFCNDDRQDDLYVTYNVEPDDYRKTPNTIMIHRKKETNTLYTVNALNTVIRFENDGVLDKRYQIDWNRYRNSLILSDDGELRHIYLKMVKKISL
jgi:hypothetical protein